MSDEDLSLGVSVDGVAESVSKLGEVQAAEKRLEDATRRAALSMSTENVAAYKKAAAELTSLKTVADAVTRSQTGVHGATGQTSTKLGAFASSVGVAAGALGKLNPALGQTVAVGAQALGSIQSLATMGLGPVGIALGVVAALVTAGTALWASHTEKLERDRLALDELTAAHGRWRESQRQAALEELTASERAGSATTHEQDVASRTALNNAPGIAGDAARNAGVLREIALLQEQQQERDDERSRRRASGGRASATDPMAAAQNAEAEKAAAFRAAQAEDTRAFEDELTTLAQKGLDARAAANDNAVRQAIDDEQRRVIGIRRQIDLELAARQKAAKTMADIQAAVGQAHTLLSSIIEASAGTSERAKRKAMVAEAAVTVVDSGIQAAVEVARAAASYPDFAGIASHGLAAAGFVVAAAKAAAVAGGGGASAAAPSASGGGSSRPSTFDRAPANDTVSSGPSKVIYQVGTFPLVTQQEIGREVGRFDRIGRRAMSARI